MLRRILERTCRYSPSFRHFNERKKHDSKTDQAFNDVVVCETEYYYKQDRQLLNVVKEKTQDEVKHMQREVQIMRNKIEEYNRGINENLRFLRDLERNLSTGDKKT